MIKQSALHFDQGILEETSIDVACLHKKASLGAKGTHKSSVKKHGLESGASLGYYEQDSLFDLQEFL